MEMRSGKTVFSPVFQICERPLSWENGGRPILLLGTKIKSNKTMHGSGHLRIRVLVPPCFPFPVWVVE